MCTYKKTLLFVSLLDILFAIIANVVPIGICAGMPHLFFGFCGLYTYNKKHPALYEFYYKISAPGFAIGLIVSLLRAVLTQQFNTETYITTSISLIILMSISLMLRSAGVYATISMEIEKEKFEVEINFQDRMFSHREEIFGVSYRADGTKVDSEPYVILQ